jgi:hypothetical protein
MSEGSFRFFYGAKRNQAVCILYELFSGLGVKLLMLDDPILQNCEVFVAILSKRNLFLFLQRMLTLMLNILIFDLDDVLLILINDCKQFSLDFCEVLPYFMFVEKVHLLLGDEI